MTIEPRNDNGSQPPVADDDLVAYLDGELNPELSRDIERRLADDPELRKRLLQHQRAWELLDEVPQPEVDEGFTRSTIEMVAVTAADDVERHQRHAVRQRRLTWGVAAACWLALAAGGYAVTAFLLARPNRQLARDLPIIEHLNAYRNADNIAFLRSLADENLFTAEPDDGL
jgi:anti-sigma factor RsiW